MKKEKSNISKNELVIPLSDKINILGTTVDPVNMNSAINFILSSNKNKTSGYICVTGVHGVIESYSNKSLQRIHNSSLLTVPDGMPIVWFGKQQGFDQVGRVYGPDLMLEVLKATSTSPDNNLSLSHFFYGSTVKTLESLLDNLKKKFPNLNISGSYSPPFRDLNRSEEKELIETIKICKPDFFWVGLSTPKQELFMSKYHDILDSGIMIGVGAAFDFNAGIKKDAPTWIKNAGFQWMHRMYQEPFRLGKRYIKIVPIFLLLVLLQLLGIKKYKLN